MISSDDFTESEYAILWYFKYKEYAFHLLPKSKELVYLEMNWANIIDFRGIDRYINLKRLELHYCTKLESDLGLSSLKESLEFLHINQSKKFVPTNELYQLKELKVLCMNSCGPVNNLKFLSNFPKLIDFRFVGTNIIDGDLSPILEHPTIRTVGFLNKKHYNFKNDQINSKLSLKSIDEYKNVVFKGENQTYKYNYG